MLEFHRIKFTPHAVEVIARRDVPMELIANALRDPAVVEPHEGRRRFVGRSGVVVVVAGPDSDPVIVTILLRGSGPWTDEDAAEAFSPDE